MLNLSSHEILHFGWFFEVIFYCLVVLNICDFAVIGSANCCDDFGDPVSGKQTGLWRVGVFRYRNRRV